MDFKDQWDVDTALKIVRNKGVDSELWAEAVEWLLLYGPPEVVSILLQASEHATEKVYPELTKDNENDAASDRAAFDVTRLAKSLGVDMHDIRKSGAKKDSADRVIDFSDDDTSPTVH